MYECVCRICGGVLEGESIEGVVIAAQSHYVSFHGLQHESDVEPPGIELNEKLIREEVRKK